MASTPSGRDPSTYAVQCQDRCPPHPSRHEESHMLAIVEPAATCPARMARAWVAAAAQTVAPLWPLATAIATNSFGGFEDRPFEQAVAQGGALLGSTGYLPNTTSRRFYSEAGSPMPISTAHSRPASRPACPRAWLSARTPSASQTCYAHACSRGPANALATRPPSRWPKRLPAGCPPIRGPRTDRYAGGGRRSGLDRRHPDPGRSGRASWRGRPTGRDR